MKWIHKYNIKRSKNMKWLLFALLSIVLAGCPAHPNYNIKSSTPAYIEINGLIVCETTPCSIIPPHYVMPFGECDSRSSIQTVVSAFPLDKSKGFVQQKSIRARCNENSTVYFDMTASGGVQTIQVDR